MPRVVPSQVVELIDKLFPWAKDQSEGDQKNFISQGSMYSIAGIVDLVDNLPPELITLGPDQFAEYVSSVAALRTLIQRWRDHDFQFSRIPGLRHLSPVALIRQALATCPDEFPSTSSSGLAFITDDELRDRLMLDISAVNSAFSNNEWKAATVLAGSVIEALLLYILQERLSAKVKDSVERLVAKKVFPRKPDADLRWWDLYHYVEVTAELGILNDDTITQVRLAKNYRNFIHPGRAQRLQQQCNRSTAMTAIAALDRVSEDLTRNFSNS